MMKKLTRRLFLKITILFTFFIVKAKLSFSKNTNSSNIINKSSKKESIIPNLGVDDDGVSRVYLASKSTPENNIKNAIELMGGIGKIIKTNDIVILKPNAQWWNHGTTNTNNMKGFIELVLGIPDFNGEIIISENHHYEVVDSRGWTTDKRNGDYNLNELVSYFNDKGYKNVTKYHWVDGGPNPQPQEGDGGNGSIVNSVEEGDGYVWMSETIYHSPEGRNCIMTFPVFTSSYSGIKIDLHRGCFHNGKYVNNLKLINFSCLNHHSKAFGVTASIKNLMGIPDMTCGFQGPEPKGFFNIHFIGKRSRIYQTGINLKYYGRKFGFGDSIGRMLMEKGIWHTQYTGGSLGYWMKTVKMPELNILAAEYVGWGGRGRHGTGKRIRANCVLMSTDPVALDYIGAKQILLPATPVNEVYYKKLNNPDNLPFRKFIEECHAQGIGNLSPEKIKVIRA